MPASRASVLTSQVPPGGICPASSRSMAARMRRSIWSRCWWLSAMSSGLSGCHVDLFENPHGPLVLGP
jgi:hypothetical protein